MKLKVAAPARHDRRGHDRRGFLRGAGAVALGSAAAPVVGGITSAQASDASFAYTDRANTFTATQAVIGADLSIGDSSPSAPLQVANAQVGAAVTIDAHTMGLAAVQTNDWQGQTYDLIDIFFKSAGDAIFIAHQGGVPPGYSGPPPGADAALNLLIPYYIDDTATGRGGSVINDHTGMKGLHIESQAVVDDTAAIDLQHFGNDFAMQMVVQPPNYGQPVGTGGPVRFSDWSSSSAIRVDRVGAPDSSNAVLNIYGHTAAPMEAIHVCDPRYTAHFRSRTDGQLLITDNSGHTGLQVTSAGAVAVGSNIYYGHVQYQGWASTSGISRNMALVNPETSAGSGTSIEFDDPGSQFAIIRSTYDVRTSNSLASSLSFQVRSSNRLTERLRVGGGGIGFFGGSPVTQPSAGGSRSGNSALTSLLRALASLGLLVDSTTP